MNQRIYLPLSIEEKLHFFEMVNNTETSSELADVILKIGERCNGMIPGRSQDFYAEKHATYVKGVVDGSYPANCLTRNFGIRQQAVFFNMCNRS